MRWKTIATAAVVMLWAASAAAQTQGVSAKEIVVGTIQDLSGPIAGLGKASRNGMQMRLDELNEKGGVHGRKIKFVVEDNGYDSKKAVLAAHKLLDQEKIFVLLGHIGTAANVAVMPLLFERNVPNLFPFAPSKLMYDPVHRLKLAMFTPYYTQARYAVPRLVQQKGIKKPCIIYQDDDYGDEVLKGTEDGLASINMKLTEKTSYKRGATDFSSQVARMNGAGCDLVVLGTVIRETVSTVTESRRANFNPLFLGTTGIYFDQIHKLGGPAMDGIVATHNIAVPYADVGSEQVRAWIGRYKAKFGEDPFLHSAYGYIAADMLITGLEKAGANLSTESLLSAIERTTFPTDMFGSPVMTFSATKRLGSNRARFAEIRNGRWVEISDYFGED